jgi:hypothetical protein
MKKAVLAGVVLGAACWLGIRPGLAGGDKAAVWKPILPAAVYKDLVAREAKILEDSLEGNPSEDKIARARLAALMIAGFSLSAEAGSPQAASVEQLAIRLAKMLAAKSKLAEARKLAATLATLPADATAKLQPVDMKALLPELEDVMNHMKPKAKKGDGLAPSLQTSIPLKGALNGIEEKLRALARKKPTAAAMAKSADDMVLFSYRLAVLGEVIHEYAPAQQGKKDPKVWRELSLEMRDASVELARASAKKDADAVLKASNRLNTSCSQCHSVFR